MLAFPQIVEVERRGLLISLRLQVGTARQVRLPLEPGVGGTTQIRSLIRKRSDSYLKALGIWGPICAQYLPRLAQPILERDFECSFLMETTPFEG